MMSDRKAFSEFRQVMADNGVARATVTRLLKLAERHKMLALIATNENVAPKFDGEEKELQRELAKLVGGGIKAVHFNTDPRGPTVKLALANGQRDSMEGPFYCVPVRDLSTEEGERVARGPVMQWGGAR
jgi:hypothetical protein